MRGRVLLLVPQIAPARQHLAVAHDHRAEEIRIVAERRLLQGDAHEALVGLGRGRSTPLPNAGVTSGSATAPSAPRHQMTATDAGGRCFQGVLHAFAPLHGRGRSRVARSPERDEVRRRPAATVAPLLLPSSEGAPIMSFGMYQASIPGFIKTLNNLTAILDKAERLRHRAQDRPRCAADVADCARHVSVDAANSAHLRFRQERPGAAGRQGGAQISRRGEDLRRAQGAHRQDAEIRRRHYAEGSRRLRDPRRQRLPLGGQNVHFKGEPYLVHFVLPNFYFHATTAYDIIRSFGVEIGKRDFLGM